MHLGASFALLGLGREDSALKLEKTSVKMIDSEEHNSGVGSAVTQV